MQGFKWRYPWRWWDDVPERQIAVFCHHLPYHDTGIFAYMFNENQPFMQVNIPYQYQSHESYGGTLPKTRQLRPWNYGAWETFAFPFRFWPIFRGELLVLLEGFIKHITLRIQFSSLTRVSPRIIGGGLGKIPGFSKILRDWYYTR